LEDIMIAEILEVITPSWMKKARCKDADPTLFYPEPGEDNGPRVEAAIRICNDCPVQRQCLRWAFEIEDKWAVLGGKTANQRTRIATRVRKRRQVALLSRTSLI
jgi:WhiB family redox-sensing transcriptional regulator